MTTTNVSRLTPTELVERRNSGELWRLLDVREPWEIDISNVDGALAIPMAEIPERIGELAVEDRIAVLCHTGVRSAVVAAWLLQRGFTTVANVEGGIDAWSVEVDGAIPRY